MGPLQKTIPGLEEKKMFSRTQPLTQTTNAQIFKVEVRSEDTSLLDLVTQHVDFARWTLLKVQVCESGEQAAVHLCCTIAQILAATPFC